MWVSLNGMLFLSRFYRPFGLSTVPEGRQHLQVLFVSFDAS